MRLLNTYTRRLESFYGNGIPPYAILSHMWGEENNEVLFKHIAGSASDRHEGQQRRGYAKIIAACRQAIQDGWKYIWIDTCCIDRESSAELSEAINAMFAWYQGAQVCYAYLEDVQGDESVRDNGSTTFGIVPFERSRWFTRGWTLQELIAPWSVVFYGRDWVEIGTKASLRGVISAVTDIRAEMIVHYDPNNTSVAERMSWAALRHTTKEEDMAYCLMGLFGVNMPLLYGEGKRAFIRLQEEIMKVSDDHSLFAWESDDDVEGMLADSPYNFAGVGDVVQSDSIGSYSPYSMTNKGLHIELPLLPDIVDGQETFKAILKCTYRGDEEPTRWIVIHLQKIREGCYKRKASCALEETHIDPDNLELTPLVIMSDDTIGESNHNDRGYRAIEIKILPTNSGFTSKGFSLMTGYIRRLSASNEHREVVVFDRDEEHFGVTVGFHYGIAWLDFIKEIKSEDIPKIRSSYDEGGSRHHAVVRCLDRLSVNISHGWSVDVSAAMTRGCDDHDRQFSRSTPIVHVTIGIQEVTK